MKSKLAIACLAAGASLVPVTFAAENAKSDSDMQRAIAWERYKDLAAARQARKEARHSSVTYGENNANREMDASTQGRKVVDPGPPAYRKDKDNQKK